MTNIGISAFKNCKGLTAVTIPKSVTSIGTQAVDGCDELISVTIPNSEIEIGFATFNMCGKLTALDLGEGVQSIGDYAFENCSKLATIVSRATTAPTLYGYATFENVKSNGTLTVPTGATGYDTWMSTDEYYLGYYNWTKTESSNL